ncbi:Structural maintenance of chromosomes protein 5 [Bulinus truncatus]|nr:Structural maintenance of chromosomes protein 5 [Bulinus truncatus]
MLKWTKVERTYDSVEFKTGPYLNILIGPNGTGKSAIVCAICLGLAGKTNWLGRASDPKDFIKYGAEKAKIEIELFNPYNDSNYIIGREIYKNKASHWTYNGKSTTQKAIEELVLSLNIQVGNLCQFLPQEKVADFAKMTQQELLENTEKAIGKNELYETHQKLKEARQTARVFELDVEKHLQELDQLKQKNARLKEDVRCYHDRKNFLKKVEILKMKKPWLEYHYLKDSYDRGKAERDKKAEDLKQAKKHILPLERKHASLKKEIEVLNKESAELSQKMRSESKDVEDHVQIMNTITEKMADAKNDFESKLKEEETRKQKLHDLQEQLKALESALAQMKDSDSQTTLRNLDKVSKEINNVNHSITSVQADGDILRREIQTLREEKKGSELRLQSILDVNNRRLELLRTLHIDTYEAVKWLRDNKSLFKYTIHEPMLISLNVNKPDNARLVESHISFNDLKAFVCEDPDDLSLFMKKMTDTLHLKVNAVKAPSQPVSFFQPKYPISHYKKYGFEGYMKDLFSCPDPVMSYLCLMYKVYCLPVGSSAVKDNQELIIKECPELNTFYAPDVQFSIKKSRYSNSMSSKNTALKAPKLLVDSMNVTKEQELQRLLKDIVEKIKEKENDYKLLQKQSEDLELRINSLREEKRNLCKERDHKKNIESQITTKTQRIQQVIKEELNVKAEEKKLKLLLGSFVKEKLRCIETMKKKISECLTVAKDRSVKILQLAVLAREFTKAETELQNEKQKFDDLERQVKDLQDQAQELKQQAREKLIEAKKRADIRLNDNLEDVLRTRVWEDFNQASSNIDELDSEIHSMQARAESMFQIDERVVRDFEKRENDIEKLEKLLQHIENKRQTHQNDITESKKSWLEPLQRLIEQINNKFSYFFASLQCCGEVTLKVPENSEDYEKYGVCIKVKFRDHENLMELTACHQSGGERSVSTVLYMLALQELTKCPFRCVDEINQGMDPNNERKIFTLVVQTVCKTSASQYFLLTPKLLPDLDYDEHITVLCVYNGPELMEYNKWSLKKFIGRRAAIESA